MKWMLKNDQGLYWREDDPTQLGIAGEWTADRQKATKYSENFRNENRANIPALCSWEVFAMRHSDALMIDKGACNPVAIAYSLHQAFREVVAEGGDTRAQREDPACRLIMHQLAFLLGMTGGYDLPDYRKFIAACESKLPNPTGR